MLEALSAWRKLPKTVSSKPCLLSTLGALPRILFSVSSCRWQDRLRVTRFSQLEFAGSQCAWA